MSELLLNDKISNTLLSVDLNGCWCDGILENYNKLVELGYTPYSSNTKNACAYVITSNIITSSIFTDNYERIHLVNGEFNNCTE